MWVPAVHPVAGPAVRSLDIYKGSEKCICFLKCSNCISSAPFSHRTQTCSLTSLVVKKK